MSSTTLPTIVEFVDEGLGHSSYLVDLGDGTALIVDPARFPTRQREEAAGQDLTIAFTADTHTHADYVSGSADLAADGATFIAPAAANLVVEHRGVADGDELEVGTYRLRVIATPGHTPDHLAYLLVAGDRPVAVFTGGSLMVGTAGRTDLVGPDETSHLAHEMWHSLHDDLLALPDDVAVYPTHGAGSFCAAPAGSARTSTIGRERSTNLLLALDEDAFVEQLVGGFGTLPAHFRRLPEVNRLGPRRYPDVPNLARLTPSEARSLIESGAQLVDVRSLEAFAVGHPAGALSIVLRSVLSSWAGWLLDPVTPAIFIIDDDQDEDDLVRQCLTVGIENLAGRLDGGADAWHAAGLMVESIPLVEPTQMAPTVIDDRQAAEFAAGHVPDALNIELGALSSADIPDGPLTLMCGHGERAMTGASILAARGHCDVTVLTGGPGTWATATGRALALGP
jgi:glyoxylase-like metal-dependent hydrolase (beta-lactamase superfamily II)/rhodanese-related sulfurtransferase